MISTIMQATSSDRFLRKSFYSPITPAIQLRTQKWTKYFESYASVLNCFSHRRISTFYSCAFFISYIIKSQYECKPQRKVSRYRDSSSILPEFLLIFSDNTEVGFKVKQVYPGFNDHPPTNISPISPCPSPGKTDNYDV